MNSTEKKKQVVPRKILMLMTGCKKIVMEVMEVRKL